MSLPNQIIIKSAVNLRNNLYAGGVFAVFIGAAQVSNNGMSLFSLGLFVAGAVMFKIASSIVTRKNKRAEGAIYK